MRSTGILTVSLTVPLLPMLLLLRISSLEQMLAELRSWRAMVVPILRSTGVNTKLFPALQLGVPIVLTSVAASVRLPQHPNHSSHAPPLTTLRRFQALVLPCAVAATPDSAR